MPGAELPYVPPRMAAEARDLLLGFLAWAEEQPTLMADPKWTRDQMVDLFIMEAGGNDPDGG